MHLSAGPVVLMLGLFLVIASQIVIAFHALVVSPLQGLACLLVPLYVFIYARKHKTGIWFMRAWYAGIALWVVGGVLSS